MGEHEVLIDIERSFQRVNRVVEGALFLQNSGKEKVQSGIEPVGGDRLFTPLSRLRELALVGAGTGEEC
jgi:hypothetical protein